MERSLKILVVDGSRVSRRLISRTLINEMHTDISNVVTVASASEAMKEIASSKYDLITSSLQLPDMDGLDLCRSIRRDSAHRYTPFIVVTGEPHKRIMKQGFSAGVTDYYDKTKGYKNFIEFVRTFIDRSSALSGRVLFVEDDQVESNLTSAMLRDYGLDVVNATSAEQALKILDDSFDLVLLDFYLDGEMSGGDFVHNVRCALRYSREALPILVVTGQEDADMQAKMFHAGSNDFVCKPIVEEALISRIRSLLLIKNQFVLLKRQSEEMRYLASIDVLTDVFNKRYLLEHIGDYFYPQNQQPVAMALIDLDHFKMINDQFGHLAGDRVLTEIGSILKHYCHPPDCLVCRFGGEEFLIMSRSEPYSQFVQKMDKLCKRIENAYPAGYKITASIGAACSDGRSSTSFNDLLQAADKAVYQAKRNGRNRLEAVESQADKALH